MLAFVGYLMFCKSQSHSNIKFIYAVLIFLEGICLSSFKRITEVISWQQKEVSLFPYIGLNCKRAIRQLYSITLTNVNKCRGQVLHPQKFGLYSRSPPLAELLAGAAHETLLSPACVELSRALAGEQHEKSRRGAEAELTRSRLLRAVTRASLSIMYALPCTLCLLFWVFLFVLKK